MLEMVISVMVLSIGVLGVMSAMTYSVSQQAHAEIVPVAAFYAQQIMQDIDVNNRHSAGITPPALPNVASGVNSSTQVAIDTAPFTTLFANIQDTNGSGGPDAGDDDLNLERFQRTITMTRLDNNSTNYRYGLVRVTVTIIWQEATGVDTVASGNSQEANTGGKTSATRRYVLETILDND